MADNKKYYYLKLKENFFDSDSMVLLESMQDGILYSNILMKMYLKSLNSDNARDRINSILDAGLLILDEIGAIEESRDWISNAIFRLVDYRYTHILPTIYTSNIEIDKLKCDERAKDRIFELSYKIHMPEESIRRLRAEKRRSKFMDQIK